MDQKALLALWELDDIPACEVGMKLAQEFLVAAGEGVNRMGVEEPADRITELTAAYMAMIDHGADCDNCNEVDELRERDDIPEDSEEKGTAYLADREIGFQAGLDGAEMNDTKSKGWQRGWADAQE